MVSERKSQRDFLFVVFAGGCSVLGNGKFNQHLKKLPSDSITDTLLCLSYWPHDVELCRLVSLAGCRMTKSQTFRKHHVSMQMRYR